jgi:hypothetical protein
MIFKLMMHPQTENASSKQEIFISSALLQNLHPKIQNFLKRDAGNDR